MRLIQAVKPLSDRDVLVLVGLPPREEGHTAEEVLAAWKSEVLALKRQHGALIGKANLYLSGPLTVHTAAYAVEALRSAVRNLFIQAADTRAFLRVSGIDPDTQVQAALGQIREVIAAAVPSRTWRAVCLDCRHVWETVGAEPVFCPHCKSADVAAREIQE